jgi:hypothetical protein
MGVLRIRRILKFVGKSWHLVAAGSRVAIPRLCVSIIPSPQSAHNSVNAISQQKM